MNHTRTNAPCSLYLAWSWQRNDQSYQPHCKHRGRRERIETGYVFDRCNKCGWLFLVGTP